AYHPFMRWLLVSAVLQWRGMAPLARPFSGREVQPNRCFPLVCEWRLCMSDTALRCRKASMRRCNHMAQKPDEIGGAQDKLGTLTGKVSAAGASLAGAFADIAHAPGKAGQLIASWLTTSGMVQGGLQYIRETVQQALNGQRLNAHDAGEVAPDLQRLFATLHDTAVTKLGWLRRGGGLIWLPGAKSRVNPVRLAFELDGWGAVGSGTYSEAQQIHWKLCWIRQPLPVDLLERPAIPMEPLVAISWPDFAAIPWEAEKAHSNLDQLKVEDIIAGAIWVAETI